MSATTVSIEVNRPAGEVFAYATDPSRFGEWQKGVVSGRMEPEASSAAGQRCVTVRRIGLAERPATSELVHTDPPRSWQVRGIDGPIRALVDVSVVPVSADTASITIAVDFEGHGIGKVLVPLMVRREARKEMPGNLARLKERLERRE
jgi:hypothetical protein